MKLLIQKITETIESTLKDQVKTVPKNNISSQERATKKTKNLPNILIQSPEFKVDETSVSGSEPEGKETVEEKFNGDGKTVEFKLSQKALRPLLAVEYPAGEVQKEPEDYKTDYSEGRVTFRTPPSKGKNNIVIRFNNLKSSSEIRSLRLSLKYLVEVNAEDEAKRDDISLDALRALVIAREALENQGVAFKILGGQTTNLNHKNGDPQDSASRLIECLAETKFLVEIPASAMEKIVIKKVE